MDLVKDKLSNFFAGGPTQYYRFEGKANYHVEVIESPDRKLPLNTSSVRLKIYSTKEKNFELPVKIKWFRLVADRNYEIEELDNMDFYNFSAMDIGGEIKASIRSNDENFKGTLSVIFGPIRFDDILRPPLEQVLISGFSKFNVLVPSEDDGPDQLQTISVFLSPNQMKFLYYNDAEPEEFYLEILNERPRLEIVYSQSQDLALYFDEVGVEPPTRVLRRRIYTDCGSAYGEKFKLVLRFFSRNTRDIFVTAVRLFRIVPVVSLSNLFRQIDILVRENRMFEANSKLSLNEVLVEYDRVRTHLMSTIEYAKDLDKDREELQECVTVLERDLEHTMTEFRKYIEESMRGVPIHNRSAHGTSNLNTSAYKKIEDLNASLLSNQGDMRSVIRKKIDQANPELVKHAVQGSGAAHASITADLQKANDEIERLKKVNAMYLAEMKKYSTDLKKYEAKRQAQKSNIRQMKEHLNNVSKEFGNLQEITEQVRGNTSAMNSKMFDVSGIESRRDEDEGMFVSNPMFLEPTTFKKGKELTSSTPSPSNPENGHLKKFEYGSGLPKIDESQETSTTGKTEREKLTLELRAKEEEIIFLRKKIRDTENLYSDSQKKLTQMMVEKSQIQQQVQVSQLGQSGKVEILQKELASLKLKEVDWKKESEESTKFIEDMRSMLKKLINDDESVWKLPINNSVLDESLVNDVFKVNLNTKLKMLDLENDGLKRKFLTLSKEVALLREENRQLKSQDPKVYNPESILASGVSQPAAPQIVYQVSPGGLSKEEADSLKRRAETLSQENESLKQLINRLKTQETEVLGESSVSGQLKQEIADLHKLNDNLMQQKLDFMKKFEQTKMQYEDGKARVARMEEELARQMDKSKTDALIIQQLTTTNERVIGELSRLQERMHVYEEGKNSFISDMNDSFYTQGQQSSVQGKFK